jgi:hypothetical protein
MPSKEAQSAYFSHEIVMFKTAVGYRLSDGATFSVRAMQTEPPIFQLKAISSQSCGSFREAMRPESRSWSKWASGLAEIPVGVSLRLNVSIGQVGLKRFLSEKVLECETPRTITNG